MDKKLEINVGNLSEEEVKEYLKKIKKAYEQKASLCDVNSLTEPGRIETYTYRPSIHLYSKAECNEIKRNGLKAGRQFKCKVVKYYDQFSKKVSNKYYIVENLWNKIHENSYAIVEDAFKYLDHPEKSGIIWGE